MSFADQTIIITGASSGIGKVLAIKLAQQRANLVLAARSQSALEKTASECIKAGGKAVVVPTDVTNQKACQKLIAESVTAFGEISCLINNAGIGMWARFDEMEDLSIFEEIMRVNYLGSVYCSHYALPYLKQSRGLLVAISSLTGKTGVPTRSGYAASKHAMQGFFDSLRIELKGTGVDVLIVSPGFVATDIRQHILGAAGKFVKATLPDEQEKAMSPEVCADLIVKAMTKRQRELVMTLKGKLGLWLKLLMPNLVDRLAARAVSSQKIND
ncbi:SDR family oxidoreductase [Pleurocapsales cyanobacterium LEGE 10410]|nr:SDR family oxidoreductase [Pleurocapsales cyanobacterium LEGE 10410]